MIIKELKSALLEECSQIIEERYQRIKHTLSNIEEALFEESKNSAGDKHETARAMLQIDRENVGKQLIEVEKIKQHLKKLDLNNISDHAHLGSLVYTNRGIFFISESVGTIEIESATYIAVSPNSPIGHLLIGKVPGEKFTFHENEYKLTKVC